MQGNKNTQVLQQAENTSHFVLVERKDNLPPNIFYSMIRSCDNISTTFIISKFMLNQETST